MKDNAKTGSGRGWNERNISPVESRQIPGNGKTDPRTGHSIGEFVADSIEGSEKPLALFPRDPRPLVGHLEGRAVTLLTTGNLQETAGCSVLFHITEQVAKYLFESIPI
jgi:hypothetical protein